MKANICDRCGKFYEPMVESGRKFSTIFWHGTNTQYSHIDLHMYPGADVDLCSSCFEELIGWWNWNREGNLNYHER